MALEFLKNGFGTFRVIPETGIQRLLFFVFNLSFALIDVKDTSLTTTGAPSDRLIDQWSCFNML
jgi:hypothetical protein